ncbi:MAG: hypothetical protein QW751_02430 [Candidatus Aenigmatarchaeota archaeon]|nr:hypothetical protein [Candidatus Aenigmarchaeota archaeon]
MKKVFQVLDDAKEEHAKLQAALDEGEVSADLLAGWIGAELDLLTEIIKKVEELEERLDLMKKRF